MTKEDIEIRLAEGNLSNPELRALDFLRRRVSSDEDSLTTIVSERRTRDIGLAEVPPSSMASARLQQLQLFRQKQQEDELAFLEVGGLRARDLAQSGKLNWQPIGPAGVDRGQGATSPVISGRVTGIAIAPGGNRVYIASANGGAWYSRDAGKTWVPLMNMVDIFPTTLNKSVSADSLSCGAIAIVAGKGQSDDVIFIGSGEGGSAIDRYFGVGPMVSRDGGASWNTEGSLPLNVDGSAALVGKSFYEMVVDPDNPERVVAATNDGIYIRELVGGNYIWNQKLQLSAETISSVVGSKSGGTKRFFAASQTSQAVYTSDLGVSWTPLTNGFPTSRVGRTALAVHPHNPNIVYALIAATDPEPPAASLSNANPKNGNLLGIFRLNMLTDQTWYPVTGQTAADTNLMQTIFGSTPATDGGQGWYDICLIVAPDNINRIYIGGSTRYIGGAWSGSVCRCDLTVQGSAATTQIKAHVTDLGGSCHADIHNFCFVPNDAQRLWVACDGGVFSTNQAKAGTGNIFDSRNAGLQTLTHNYLANNPFDEENLYACAQDNGNIRYLGEDVWLHVTAGDAGYCVVNWHDPDQFISTYTNNTGEKANHAGNRAPTGVAYNTTSWSVPLTTNAAGTTIEQVLFYAPLTGVPFKEALPVRQAKILAFGTQRPWISLDFGDNWKPIPSQTANNQAQFIADRTILGGSTILTMTFAASDILLVGLGNGRVFKYEDKSAGNDWTNAPNAIVITRLDNEPAVGNPFLTLGKSITCIAVHPTDATKFYVTLGGASAGTQRVWLYDPAAAPKWADKSGGLIDVHFNTIAINPKDPTQLFAGSDVGIWKSDNGGTAWTTFSFGLPETPIIDLKFFYRKATDPLGELLLLRASTHGRGVFECNLSEATTPDVKLFVRGHILDGGRNRISLTKKDPRDPSVTINQIDTPDIKIDVPNNSGLYAFRHNETLSSGQFQLTFEDKAQQVPVPATGEAVSRVYVQIHSRGIVSANNVHVFLLMKEITSGTLPDLPPNYKEKLQNAIPIEADGWKTIGIRLVHDIAAGSSKIIQFDLSSSLLPAHAAVGGGGKNFVLVALLHHPSDTFASDDVKIDPSVSANNVILSDERKAMFKRIKVVQHAAFPSVAAPLSIPPLAGFVRVPDTATLPEAPYDAFLGMSFRVNDDVLNQLLMSRLAQPISNRGTDEPAGNPNADHFYLANTIETTADITLREGVPLIWMAREKIIINNNIIGLGKSTTSGDGDFGGSGGGSATNAGKASKMPRRASVTIAAGGGTGGSKVGTDLDASWASRALLMLPFAKGGAAGGDDGANKGGIGGGIVILCAPKIEITGTAKIDVSGGLGAGNAGGGGGGLIILIAGDIINPITEGATANLVAEGGNSAGTGGKGGKGIVIMKKYIQTIV